MTKHKEAFKWVAVLDQYANTPCVKTALVRVIETPKQFRLVEEDSKEFRLGVEACGYCTRVNKSQGRMPLYETERAALVVLRRDHEQQVKDATNRLKRKQCELDLILRALPYGIGKDEIDAGK